MNWKQWVLDATMGYDGGMFTFCPVEGDINSEYTVVTGMNYLSDEPPEGCKVVAIIHADGQEAVEAFCEKYATELETLRAKLYG